MIQTNLLHVGNIGGINEIELTAMFTRIGPVRDVWISGSGKNAYGIVTMETTKLATEAKNALHNDHDYYDKAISIKLINSSGNKLKFTNANPIFRRR